MPRKTVYYKVGRYIKIIVIAIICFARRCDNKNLKIMIIFCGRLTHTKFCPQQHLRKNPSHLALNTWYITFVYNVGGSGLKPFGSKRSYTRVSMDGHQPDLPSLLDYSAQRLKRQACTNRSKSCSQNRRHLSSPSNGCECIASL